MLFLRQLCYPDFLHCHVTNDLVYFQTGEEAQFLEGQAHEGILQGAKLIVGMAKSEIAEALERKRGYKLVVTGHSLGAGTAILVTLELLLGDDCLNRYMDIQCIALAPPPGGLAFCPSPLAKLGSYSFENPSKKPSCIEVDT